MNEREGQFHLKTRAEKERKCSKVKPSIQPTNFESMTEKTSVNEGRGVSLYGANDAELNRLRISGWRKIDYIFFLGDVCACVCVNEMNDKHTTTTQMEGRERNGEKG